MEGYTEKQTRLLTHRSPSLPDLSSGLRRAPYVTTLDPNAKASRAVMGITANLPPRFDFNSVASTTIDEEVPDLLHVPISSSNRQSINSSADQLSNLSVIDLYGDVESVVSSNYTNGALNMSSPEMNEERVNNLANLATQGRMPINRSGSAIASDLQTLQSSRESASKIRLSIEESRTSVSSDRDRYGFKKRSNFVSESQYNTWWVDYASHCARRKKKWQIFMKKNGLSTINDSPERFPARSEKLKRYIRKGIPAEWRGNAWWYFAKGPEKLKNNAGVYDSLVESTINLRNKDTEIIERDLNRTFPDNIHFRPERAHQAQEAQPETPLIQSLRRVLVAFSTYNPAVGYCQSLNFIAGLLLIFMDEEKTFWMLVIITSRYLPGVHEINLEGVSIDQGVLMLSLQEFLPDTWEKISQINFADPSHSVSTGNQANHDFLVNLPPITLCTSSWFMSTFIGILPIETTLRVWDCFFYEESSFLFKVALSIFKHIEPKVLATHDEMEVFQIVQNTPKTLIDPSTLFEIIFKKRVRFTALTQEEVMRCRKYVTQRRQKAKIDHSATVDVDFNRSLLSESLWQPNIYGFKKGLPGVHWNRNLTNKMKSKIKKTR